MEKVVDHLKKTKNIKVDIEKMELTLYYKLNL